MMETACGSYSTSVCFAVVGTAAASTPVVASDGFTAQGNQHLPPSHQLTTVLLRDGRHGFLLLTAAAAWLDDDDDEEQRQVAPRSTLAGDPQRPPLPACFQDLLLWRMDSWIRVSVFV